MVHLDPTLAATMDAEPQHGTAKTQIDDPFVTANTLVHEGETHERTKVDGGGSGRTTSASLRQTVVPRIVEEQGEARIVHTPEERYRVDELIGAGGMGEVARAFDRDIGRTVAVKRMLPDVTGPRLVARFVDEVRTLGRLHHPNIIPIHDVDVDPQGQLFFTMPLVEGVPLDAVIEALKKGDPEHLERYPLSRRLDIFAGIVDALGHAHAQDVVHRDVKPANVMVGPFGEVMLLDWGIARLGSKADATTLPNADVVERATAKTRFGHVVGTPHYMAPEQARGDVDAIGPATDLYAAFVVLFELLTLTSYVKAEDMNAALLEVVAKAPPGLEFPDYVHVPVELRHFLRHGLATSPAERYPSATVVLGELARIRSGDFRVECPVTYSKHMTTRYLRFVDARPVLALSLVALVPLFLLVLLVLVVVLLVVR